MRTRNLNTPESRAFWSAAERVSRRVAAWPAWKLGQLEPRRAESMATKKEVWIDNAGHRHDTELSALYADWIDALDSCGVSLLSPPAVAAIDVLHEYAHRVETKDNPPDTQKDQTARPTLDEIAALRKGDEVMISGAWFKVHRASDALICVTFEGVMTTDFDTTELVHICQGIRRHG